MKVNSYLQLLASTLLWFMTVSSAIAFEQIYYVWKGSPDQSQSKWFGDYYVKGGKNDSTLKVGGWTDRYVSMVKLPINLNVPGNVIINGANLYLYSYGSTRPTTMKKLFFISPWSETSTTDHWNIFNGGQYYNLGTVSAPPVDGWYSIDISSEFYVWLVGSYQNYGIGLYPDNVDNRFNYFYSTKGPIGQLDMQPFILVRYEVIPDLKMPLPGGVGWKLTVEAGGRTFDQDPVWDTNHTNRPYYSLDFSPNWIPLAGGVQHTATDVPIFASAGGKVIPTIYNPSNPDNPNGWHVKIDHDRDGNASTGVQTIYIHLKNRPLVNIGDTVVQGQQIGVMGDTGVYSDGRPTAQGVHLHMTVYFQDAAGPAPNWPGSIQLNVLRMEGVFLKDYKLNSNNWHPELSPPQYWPAFYPSSNTSAPL